MGSYLERGQLEFHISMEAYLLFEIDRTAHARSNWQAHRRKHQSSEAQLSRTTRDRITYLQIVLPKSLYTVVLSGSACSGFT